MEDDGDPQANAIEIMEQFYKLASRSNSYMSAPSVRVDGHGS